MTVGNDTQDAKSQSEKLHAVKSSAGKPRKEKPGNGKRLAGKLHVLLRGRNWMLGLAAILLFTAAVLPPIQMKRSVFSHLAVFDVTQSMNVADYTVKGKAVSRLDFAKQQLIDSMATLPCGSQLGLGVFANRRTLLVLAPVEICGNRYELTQAISQINSRMAWEHASVISRGLYTAIDVAAELAQAPSLLFVTDGHAAPPVEDNDIPSFDKPTLPIRGIALGVGGFTPQPIPRSDKEGRFIGWWTADDVMQRAGPAGSAASQEHLSALHETHLNALAKTTGLRYVRLDGAKTLGKALSDPSLAKEQVVPTDVRWLPALIAGLLLLGFYLPLEPVFKRSQAGSTVRHQKPMPSRREQLHVN